MRRTCLVRRLPGIALALLSTTPGAPAQSLRWTRDGSAEGEESGSCLAWLPDRDGDGIDEIVAGAPGGDRVRVLSGRDLALLLEIAGPAGGAFGTAVAVIDDRDGDGVADLAIGAPGSEGVAGVVQLRSSRNGAQLAELRGGSSPRFGRAIATLDDVDGDGAPELAVGMASPDATRLDPGQEPDGALAIVSSSRDAILAWRFGARGDHRYGERVESLRDLDGDGRRDLATIAWQPDDAHAWRDGVRPTLELLSGATLAPIRVVDLTGMGGQVSQELLHCAVIGDADHDGFDDVAVADAGPLPEEWGQVFKSLAWVVSGATGERLREWRQTVALSGEGIGAAGDVDGDGRNDLAITRNYGPAHPPNLQRLVAILSVRTGHLLRLIDPEEYGEYEPSRFCSVIAGGRDLDGDALPDLVAGSPATRFIDLSSRGRVMTFSSSTQRMLAVRWGGDVHRPFAGACAGIGDVDGDGVADVAASEWWNGFDPGSVALLSGRDGALLRRIAPDEEDFDFGAAVASLPDLDGDGVLDLAIGATERVEVRSGRDGRLLRTVTKGLDPGAVRAIAAGLQPDGHLHLIAGQPSFRTKWQPIERGNVVIWDLTADRGVHQRKGVDDVEQLGRAVAFLGDVTNDGIGDWAVGAPGHGDRAGRVAVLNGATGAIQKQLFGSAPWAQFGSALVAVGDATGDGFGDLIIGSPGTWAYDAGRVTLFASRAWSAVWSFDGAVGAMTGSVLQSIGDPNRNGFADFAMRSLPSAGRPQVELRSAASGRLLATIEERDGAIGGDGSFGLALAAASPWLDDAVSGATIWIDAPLFGLPDPYSPHFGRIEAFDLPSLFLEITPRRASVGAKVRGDVRGAPAAVPVGILVAEIDGVPYGQFISLGVADPFGEYLDWSIVPPGLTGSAWKLIAYATGFSGELVESSEMELTFQ